MKKIFQKLSILGLIVGAVLISFALLIGSSARSEGQAAGTIYVFGDVEEETRKFHSYYRSIDLTPEQDAIMRDALIELPAPCCSDKTALTCCCKCNMAKSWWGLSKHLIADRGMGAEEVKTAVSEWFQYINPRGFSGDSCYTGGCARPFRENGCGGMTEETLVF